MPGRRWIGGSSLTSQAWRAFSPFTTRRRPRCGSCSRPQSRGRVPELADVDVQAEPALSATASDVLAADAILMITLANIGYT